MKTKEYWERNYKKNGVIWGNEPSYLAKLAVLNGWFRRGKKVLEIGGGYGRNSIFFAKNGIEAFSLDLSEVATQMGVLAADHAGVGVRFVKGDAERLPELFRDERFDGVFSNFCMHLVDSPENIIRQVPLILDNSGTAVFSLLSTEDKDFGKGKEVGPNRFERDDGKVQRFFSEKDAQNLFAQMKIAHLEHVWELERVVNSVYNTPFWIVVAGLRG